MAICGRSQAQPNGTFHCAQAIGNHNAFLHDVKQAIVRQLLGNLPGERHEPAPICSTTVSMLRRLVLQQRV